MRFDKHYARRRLLAIAVALAWSLGLPGLDHSPIVPTAYAHHGGGGGGGGGGGKGDGMKTTRPTPASTPLPAAGQGKGGRGTESMKP